MMQQLTVLLADHLLEVLVDGVSGCLPIAFGLYQVFAVFTETAGLGAVGH